MADLNAWLVEELAQARAMGRAPAFHVSATLATTIHQVNASGRITNSYNDGQEFLDFIDGIGMQFHVFNVAKVAVMNGAEYECLDAQQQFTLSQILDEVLGEDTLICNLLSALQKYLIGPISIFQQYDVMNNIHALSAGNHALVPNFSLPPGWTWAQLPGIAFLDASQYQDFGAAPDVIEEMEKPADRIPRPPNPFIIYRAAHHKAIADANPEASNNEISAKMIGRQWQSESEEVRQGYRSKAAEIKAAFMLEHPNYKYSPRKSCDVKRRAKKNLPVSQEKVPQQAV
ncbi:unnamed protein product [Discula destructiva]